MEHKYAIKKTTNVQLGARNFAHQFLCHLKNLVYLSFMVIIINHDIM
jgi:hypothetical protein